MTKLKTTITNVLLLAILVTAEARLRGDKNTDSVELLHMAMQATRMLKAGVGIDGDGETKNIKTNKTGVFNPIDPPTSKPSASPTSIPTSRPASSPTVLPTATPSASPTGFDSTILVNCLPDGTTALTLDEARAKTIICNATKESCRKAVTAVKASSQLRNFFGCAGDLGEAAARKLFNRYATNAELAEQLRMVADAGMTLVTERPDVMKAACMAIAQAQTLPNVNPCCQGASGCTSATASASTYPQFMTVAVDACVGDYACKDMGPNPLILDSSCTGASACELMNENEVNPSITGVTFVGEMACTTSQSCEGVGRRSHGDVIIQTGACIGSDACNAVGRRVEQSAPSFRFRSHINIGANACVGSNACKDAHSTVDHGTAGKHAGSLTIGDGGCARDDSCEKLGFTDRMETDIIISPGACSGASGCRGCMTKSECKVDEVYLISDEDGACPKGGTDTNNNPTGDKVDEFCVSKDTLPTDCPTFFPTPFPTLPGTPSPTRTPSSIPTTLPSQSPSQTPSILPSDQPSDLPSHRPSDLPSEPPSNQPSDLPSEPPSNHPSDLPSDLPSAIPSEDPSDLPSDIPSLVPSRSQAPSESMAPSLPPASLDVGCLADPGVVTSTFNPVSGPLLCDSAVGTCANFVAAVDAFSENRGRMIKSIFACDDSDPNPQPVAQDVAQARFDKIKNDASVTAALLKTLTDNKKLYTASAGIVTTACNGNCCTQPEACKTNPASGVMTVSDGSCIADHACEDVFPDIIILSSCASRVSCFGIGAFMTDQPNAAVDIGFRVIGPATCLRNGSCQNFGTNIFGNIRIEEGACNGDFACSDTGIRTSQGATTAPNVASIVVRKNACEGMDACKFTHGGFSKTQGSLLIEEGACQGGNSCVFLGLNNDAINDIVIKQGVCDVSKGETCKDCIREEVCGGDTALTYTIDNAGEDCASPNPLACAP